MVPLLIFAAVAFVLSCVGTRALLGLLRRGAVLDHPNDRSSHSVPTPRGGGLAVVASLVAVAAVAAQLAGYDNGIGFVLGATLGLAILSFVDDLKNLSATLRLSAHSAAVVLGLWALGGEGAFAGLLPDWADLALTAFAWLWFINLYNFMDGIDGIDASEAVAIGIGVTGLALLGTAPAGLAGPAMALVGAAAGFLVWNWHPARIFLGDAGSVPMGYVVGYLLIALAQSGGASGLAAALALPMVFVVDASLTLLRRLVRGKRLTEAHREHAYQRAVQGGWSHARVCLAVGAVNAGLVALAWGVAPTMPVLAVGLSLVAATALYAGLHRIGARREAGG
jgi:Fuc2NAc and GlcNAc transferase